MLRTALLICLLSLPLSGCLLSAATTGAQAVYNRNDLQQSFANETAGYNANKALVSDPDLKNKANISVTSTSKVLLLTGQVPTETAFQRAAAVAKEYAAGRYVLNELVIGPPVSDEQTTEDTWITTKIRSQILATNGLSPGNFKVVTEDGVVYLLGAAVPEEVDTVVDIAKNTDGVKKVVKLIYYIYYGTG